MENEEIDEEFDDFAYEHYSCLYLDGLTINCERCKKNVSYDVDGDVLTVDHVCGEE